MKVIIYNFAEVIKSVESWMKQSGIMTFTATKENLYLLLQNDVSQLKVEFNSKIIEPGEITIEDSIIDLYECFEGCTVTLITDKVSGKLIINESFSNNIHAEISTLEESRNIKPIDIKNDMELAATTSGKVFSETLKNLKKYCKLTDNNIFLSSIYLDFPKKQLVAIDGYRV